MTVTDVDPGSVTFPGTVTLMSRGGNNCFLASPGMVNVPIRQRVPMREREFRRRGSEREHEVRRLRDLIRSAVLAGAYPGGHLPSEAELMTGHGATRATVRTALAMLRAEGLIERTQGIGTHAVMAPVRADMEEALGVLRPANPALFTTGTRPQLLDRSTVPVPETLTGWLRVPPGTPCLRLEYVSVIGEQPFAIATNYVLFPEAGRLLDVPFRVDWYTLLAEAGVVLGESEFVMDSVLADELSASLLSVAVGSALLAMDQTITSPDGRVFNVAFIRMRTDRYRFVTHARAPL
ncbi:MAG: GntR family transcriptional regulator [Pseudonocardiales bacterium]|jgi:GntR family transcriptional regulator|nr:GntR family transcriptional regulator [Pseudonocardiales bacterium]MDT7749193.1 GntR family transcriptional regulator [Pseudonocardiales bacterium]